MTEEVVVARFGELWLKGRNRTDFERRLAKNCREALADISEVRIERANAHLIFRPVTRVHDVAQRLTEVFGFTSISLARVVAPEPEAIAAMASTVLDEALEARPRGTVIPFRVQSRRGDKRFPMTSAELDRFVADRAMKPHRERLAVELTRPELTLGVQVNTDKALVFADRMPGAGGLPAGSIGRAVCLLSGGIDSPVAAWLAMKRGCEVSFAAFHSYPFIGESYQAKVRRVVRRLARFQPRSLLHEVPFAEVQTAVRDHCPASYRTVLYRRMMQRIAGRIATEARAGALVTGDSLGQVASQTLENLACIGSASPVPVLRPLIAFDKEETIRIARSIGTYDVSIEPEPDCCTVFQPKHPILRGSLAVCEDAETSIDVEGLVEAALEGTKTKRIRPGVGLS